MRILRIAQRLPPLPGGEEYHVLELTRRQVAAGHLVRLIFGGGDASEFGGRARRVSGPVVSATADSPIGALGFGLLASMTPGIGGADVCHVHGDFTDAAFPAVVCRAKRIPSVLTVHGGLNMRYRRVASPIYQGFDRVIALGNPARADLLDHGVRPDRIVAMSSGLNQALLDEAAKIKPEAGRIVAVGSLIQMKNFGLLISAFREVPDPGASLTIVGSGPLADELQRLAGRDHRVHFAGHVDRPTVYQLVARSQVFVMPSRRLEGKGEGVPTALLEAMYLGKDCLVSREAQPRPVVTDTLSYAAFDPESPRDLGQLLRRALEQPDESSRRSERARAAVSHLGWDLVAERVTGIYSAAIADSQARSSKRRAVLK